MSAITAIAYAVAAERERTQEAAELVAEAQARAARLQEIEEHQAECLTELGRS